jgi:hypothetical protein
MTRLRMLCTYDFYKNIHKASQFLGQFSVKRHSFSAKSWVGTHSSKQVVVG